MIKGEAINNSLRRFNDWFDEFILEAIKPLAILSMGLGTVAIFNLQGLAIQPWFVISWAIVQAASIDCLFFAVWDRLFMVKLKWANALAIFGLILIGLTLAIVAIAINAILGFQVLWAISDSQVAMARLGVSSELFTAIRAVMAVVVFVMIAFVRSRARTNEKPIEAKPVARARAMKVTVVEANQTTQVAIPEVAMSHEPVASSPKYETIKAAMARAMANGEKINLRAIADECGAGYSTVKKHAGRIKQELRQSA